MTFCVKMYTTYFIASKAKRIYEESIVMVDAESFDDAYEKAEEYIEDVDWEYTNKDNETVKIENIEFVDCFKAFDEENGFLEIYSCFRMNKTELDEASFYAAISDCCTPDEIDGLRRWK